MEEKSKFKILIIDDSKVERQNLKNILNDNDYTIYEADTGILGISFATKFIPDLILLDIIMPGLDGYVTCKKLKENADTENIPVIFITGQTDILDKVSGFQVGGVDYITKPYEPLEVVLRIRNHLNLVSANKNLKNMNTQLKQLLDIQTKNLVKAERQTVFAQFIQGVVHNLKAPLSAISGYAEINNVLIEGEDIKNAKDMLSRNNKIIVESVKNVVNIVNSLLQKGRENVDEKKCVFNLNDLVNDELKFLEADLYYKTRINKIISLSPDSLLIKAIPSMISQSFQNLVKNAIDAMYDTKNATMEISTSIENNYAVIKITDNGMGIPANIINKIFDPFFSTKAENSSESNSSPTGTGLGLFICKEMIENNNGKILVSSIANEATTFTIELPLVYE